MSSYVPAHLRRFVFKRSGGACEYCLIRCEDTFVGCEIEHIISEKHGGATNRQNLAIACCACNRFKGSDIATLDGTGTGFVRLFNPRIDRWSDHFRLEGPIVHALTDIGHVTVRLLQINNDDRVKVRDSLCRMGDYPPIKTST
jgi:hypothetical protein